MLQVLASQISHSLGSPSPAPLAWTKRLEWKIPESMGKDALMSALVV